MVSTFASIDSPDGESAEIRTIFGRNLRLLTAPFPSIAALCRELGINRTQFNRYLSGESFPRPDILHRICHFFGTDARILLEPIEEIHPDRHGLLSHPQIAAWLGRDATRFENSLFPTGFYRFSRRSFVAPEKMVMGLIYIYRQDGYCFLRGHEARDAMKMTGLEGSLSAREFRGICLTLEDGIGMLISRRGAVTCSFNFLTRAASMNHNYWEGYTIRTMRETLSTSRCHRLVYEHLGRHTGTVLAAARQAGLMDPDALPPFHARLLQGDQLFH